MKIQCGFKSSGCCGNKGQTRWVGFQIWTSFSSNRIGALLLGTNYFRLIFNQKLKFVVKDYDILTSSDEIGEATIDFDEYMTKSSAGSGTTGPAKEITVPIIGGGSLKIRRTYPKTFSLSAR